MWFGPYRRCGNRVVRSLCQSFHCNRLSTDLTFLLHQSICRTFYTKLHFSRHLTSIEFALCLIDECEKNWLSRGSAPTVRARPRRTKVAMDNLQILAPMQIQFVAPCECTRSIITFVPSPFTNRSWKNY